EVGPVVERMLLGGDRGDRCHLVLPGDEPVGVDAHDGPPALLHCPCLRYPSTNAGIRSTVSGRGRAIRKTSRSSQVTGTPMVLSIWRSKSLNGPSSPSSSAQEGGMKLKTTSRLPSAMTQTSGSPSGSKPASGIVCTTSPMCFAPPPTPKE